MKKYVKIFSLLALGTLTSGLATSCNLNLINNGNDENNEKPKLEETEQITPIPDKTGNDNTSPKPLDKPDVFSAMTDENYKIYLDLKKLNGQILKVGKDFVTIYKKIISTFNKPSVQNNFIYLRDKNNNIEIKNTKETNFKFDNGFVEWVKPEFSNLIYRPIDRAKSPKSRTIRIILKFDENKNLILEYFIVPSDRSNDKIVAIDMEENFKKIDDFKPWTINLTKLGGDLVKDIIPKDPTEPTDPINPTDPNEPVDPENPADPKEPKDSENPTDPVEPKDPENTEDHENPADPVNPENPEQPTETVDSDGIPIIANNNTPNGSVKIGHWNVLNLSGISAKPARFVALANIIKYIGVDIIGLTEIKDNLAVEKLANRLNIIDSKSDWKYVVSEVGASTTASDKQKEKVGILYRNVKVTAEAFVNNDKSLFYVNNTWSDLDVTNSGINYDYVRPPFGMIFSTKGAIKNDFTVVFSHFDSPGKSSSNGEIKSSISSQGAREINEAMKLKDVMQWFDSQDDLNNELIFMGDTNIKTGNSSQAFKPLIDLGYKMYTKETNDWKSSLSGPMGSYSQTYDKIFYSGDLKAQNVGIFKNYDVLLKNVLNEAWLNQAKKEKSYNYKYGVAGYIKNFVSDHCPVYFELVLDANDKN